ncbi:hypothetical protein ER13_17975, partial [Brevundimonas sp. EAKA]
QITARQELEAAQTVLAEAEAEARRTSSAAAAARVSGDDRSFWVTDSGLSDARIVEALGEAGLAAEPLAAAGGLKLFLLAGYVQAEDGRLSAAPGRLTGVIGAAPVF